MPIDLNKLSEETTAAVPAVYVPTFFDKKLTGRGSKSSAGLLSADRDPIHIAPDARTSVNNSWCRKKTYINGTTTTTEIPLYTLPKNARNLIEICEKPKTGTVTIGTSKHVPTETLSLSMEINTIIIEDTSIPQKYQAGNPTKKRTVTTNYRIRWYDTTDSANNQHICSTAQAKYPQTVNTYHDMYSDNPLYDINEEVKTLTSDWNIDNQAILDFIGNYSLYDEVCRVSEVWQTTIDQDLDALFFAVKDSLQNISDPTWDKLDHYVQQALIETVQYIMTYNIPLNLYKNIYGSLTQHLLFLTQRLCRYNLNLLLSDTLNNLNNNKGQIPSFTPPDPAIALPPGVQALSREQYQAVTSTEPLILVQAGAGTGKSTLILGRIAYLTACGVNPADITVLSFTNAAADHIAEKNPNVHSMTIARMIHEIYSANFDGHELSSLDTIINSLEIYYPDVMAKSDPILQTFRKKLIGLIRNDPNGFTEMNNFIEEHYDDVIGILDKIHQTSLELEIIICYQKISTFVEPASVASKYLIIDEVQDNSVFEFVYMLKYIEKHKESLFIVGDSSQTLFEFRASNPRALNILEGSGTFATYQLNTNYRSNQEILEFANVALQNIEANQYAQIRLQANSLRKPTEDSFLQQVHFYYQNFYKISDLPDAMPSIFSLHLRDYINDCLAKGEQIAFLAYTRQEVYRIQSILENQYPNYTAVSLVPEKMYNSTVLSSYISRYWDSVPFLPMNNLPNILIQEIMAKLPYLTGSHQKAAPAVHAMLCKWQADEGAVVNSWVRQFQNGQMTQKDMLNHIRENLLQYEIRHNAIKQSLLSARNQQVKSGDNVKNANFLLSTIHSAKGLEFDNVVVLYRNENQMDEEKKRMYYVAFTRAMKSEFILAYGTVASPQIEADYLTVLEKLHAIAPSPDSPLYRIKPDQPVSIKI